MTDLEGRSAPDAYGVTMAALSAHPEIPPFRRVPFKIQVGDGVPQEVGYFDARDLVKDSDEALIGILRAVADEIEHLRASMPGTPHSGSEA